MAVLSSLTEAEIGELLDEYGIRHGPIVDSTRSLYEKKIREAMASEKPKVSPDKTYYREEEEEITYVTRTPVRSEAAADGCNLRTRSDWTDRDYEYEAHMYKSEPNTRTFSAPPQSPTSKPPARSSRLVPLWCQFLFFVSAVVFIYLLISNLESNQSIQGIE